MIVAEALACFLICYNFAPDHHITAAHSLAWGVIALVARPVLAQTANRIGLSIIGYLVAGAAANVANITVDLSRGTSSHNLSPLEIVVRGGFALVEGVPGMALANACKRETV